MNACFFPYARELGTCESFCCPWKNIYMAIYYNANQSGLVQARKKLWKSHNVFFVCSFICLCS